MAKKRGQKASSRSPAPSSSPSTLHHRSEIIGVVVLAVALLIVFALWSFAYGRPASNWLGLLGYTVGGLLYYVLGLGSFVIALFLGWVGWQLVTATPLEQTSRKIVSCIVLVISLNILLSVLDSFYPSLGLFFGSRLIGRESPLMMRLPLGGAPFEYLYTTLPRFNLQRMLNAGGTLLIFGSLLLVSFLILTQSRLSPLLEAIKRVWPKRQPTVPVEGSPAVQEPKTSLWRNVKLSLGGITNSSSTPTTPSAAPVGEVLAIRPETDLKQRPSISGKTLATAPRQPEKPAPVAVPTPAKVAPPAPVKAPTKREKALQAQRLQNGDLTGYQLPGYDLLSDAAKVDQSSMKKDLRRQAEVLEETLHSFGIEAKVGQINCGPTITSFEVHPAIGVKVQKIKALENDIALNMEARSIRIIAPIPGKAAVGIEVPNAKPQEVGFKDLLQHYQRGTQKFHIPLLLGKAVNGDYVMNDLAKMPHCIIAGATGSGKSVCINTIVMSIIINARPDQIKLLMVDPKKVELTPYTKLPHMLAPVITEPTGACAALHWLVKEMEGRYDLLKLVGVRNIDAFNKRKRDIDFEATLGREIPADLPYIVGIIDELADLMMVSSHDIETPIARIAQMARAVGIHLILATQRPSREVITGLIKANFPTRISFKVASRVNSQIILDESGSESLLGNGDMLFLPPASSHLIRAQGAYVRDEDIHRVVSHICDQVPPNYAIASFDAMEPPMDDASPTPARKEDSLFQEAREVVSNTGNASTTFLQRKLKIGYARAASLMDDLEEAGVISAGENGKGRKVVDAKAVSPEPEDSKDIDLMSSPL